MATVGTRLWESKGGEQMSTSRGLTLTCLYTFSMEREPTEYKGAINAVSISPDKTKVVAVGDQLPLNDQWAYTFTFCDLITGQQHDLAKSLSDQPHIGDLSTDEDIDELSNIDRHESLL